MNINVINEHIYIVFGFEHYNPLGIVRSLGEEGIYPVGVVVKNKKRVTSSSKYFSELYIVENIEEGYQLIINNYGNEYKKGKIPFILTSDDTMTSFLDNKYDEIKDRFIFYNAGEQGRITKYMNKGILSSLAEKNGLKIPKTYSVKRGEIPDNLQYPVITKAKDSIQHCWKDNVFICNSKSELLEAYSKISHEEILLQEYIKKKNELCIDGLSINRGNDVFLAMGSTYNYLLPQSYSFTFTLHNCEDKLIQKAVEGIMKEIGFEGIFTIEFLVGEDDSLSFIEINFRHSAWGYAATCLDMNLLTNWAYGMLEKEYPKDIYKIIPDNYVAMVELPDFKNRVIKNHMNPLKWFNEMKKCQCLYYYNKNDPKPFWTALFSSIFRWR